MQPSCPISESPQGIPLSKLLASVSKTVADHYKSGVWTVVEIMRVTVASGTGHMYLELSERNNQGAVLAKSNATIWSEKARVLIPSFERATGIKLASGLKVLLRVRPVFKAQFGFSLDIDSIDEQFTLGDFELRKKEIRQKLFDEGIFDQNKKLPRAWDFNSVLVVSPEAGAGLGDFQAEASRLHSAGLCYFEYCHSRFQGEGAGAEIRAALLLALTRWKERVGTPPDAIVILRGGGAVNDLAWLNDFGLTRLICRLPIPVLTGIGHERDSTLLDEVANCSFDTPSKVIAGIAQVIISRTRQAQAEYAEIVALATKAIEQARSESERMQASVSSESNRHVTGVRHTNSVLRREVVRHATQSLHTAQKKSESNHQAVKNSAAKIVLQLKMQVPALMFDTQSSSVHIVERAKLQNVAAFESVRTSSLSNLALQKTKVDAYMREVVGQGPEKTLKRGFALVTSNGRTISRAEQVQAGHDLTINFSDGSVLARKL